MKTVLLTAFEPFDKWTTNASWLALVELTRDLPERPRVVTRRYPVDFAAMRSRLEADLRAGYDYAIHLGQSSVATRLRLEAVGLNFGAERSEPALRLVEDGPLAYQSPLPLDAWSARLNAAGIPATVSYHAGTYLCNAALYLSCYFSEQMGLPTKSTFIHVPVDISQTVDVEKDFPSLPSGIVAIALRLILAELAGEE
jgi:pyroglutamyl-peptidase